MIDISEILKSNNADISYEALRKTEFLCEKAKELSDKYFDTGKIEYLNDAVNNLTQAVRINCKYTRIYVLLCQTCIKLELFEEGKNLLSRALKFDPGNLIAENMLGIVNKKLAALKTKEKTNAKSGDNLSEKFSKFFSRNNHNSNLKVKVSENTFSRFTKIFAS